MSEKNANKWKRKVLILLHLVTEPEAQVFVKKNDPYDPGLNVYIYKGPSLAQDTL